MVDGPFRLGLGTVLAALIAATGILGLVKREWDIGLVLTCSAPIAWLGSLYDYWLEKRESPGRGGLPSRLRPLKYLDKWRAPIALKSLLVGGGLAVVTLIIVVLFDREDLFWHLQPIPVGVATAIAMRYVMNQEHGR